MAIFKATIEYRDESSNGQWQTYSATSSVMSDAVSMVNKYCREHSAEWRNLKVKVVEE